jgi:hypothetical protein
MEMMSIVKKYRVVLISILLMACAANPAQFRVESKPADELDAAIRETSDYLNKQLPKGNKLVVLNIQSEYPALSEYIIDELIANTVNDRVFTVVDRQQLDTLRQELDFQMTGEVDDETAQALGRIAGAQIIVSGAVSRIGDLYRLRVRALSVQTAQIVGQFNRNIPNGPTLAALVRSQATGYGGTDAWPSAPTSVPVIAASSTPAPAASIPVVPSSGASGPATEIAIKVTTKTSGTLWFQDTEIASLWDNETHTIPIERPGTYTLKMVFPDHEETRSVVINTRGISNVVFGVVYKIGDTGPAVGIVFYDKGSFFDGWRYLEASPRDVGSGAPWSEGDTDTNGASTTAGSGKRNTELILNALQETGESAAAAQVVSYSTATRLVGKLQPA